MKNKNLSLSIVVLALVGSSNALAMGKKAPTHAELTPFEGNFAAYERENYSCPEQIKVSVTPKLDVVIINRETGEAWTSFIKINQGDQEAGVLSDDVTRLSGKTLHRRVKLQAGFVSGQNDTYLTRTKENQMMIRVKDRSRFFSDETKVDYRCWYR